MIPLLRPGGWSWNDRVAALCHCDAPCGPWREVLGVEGSGAIFLGRFLDLFTQAGRNTTIGR